VTPLSRIVAERDAAVGAAWHVHVASAQRDELLAAMARRPEVVPMHVMTLAADVERMARHGVPFTLQQRLMLHRTEVAA
jgi:hypothetical protein